MKLRSRILLLLLIASVSFTGCRVTLVPMYNSELDQQIANGAKMNDKLYLDLLASDTVKRSYDLYKDRYTEIEAEINSIQLKNEARKQNQDFLKMIMNLHGLFDKYRDEHKTHKSSLTDGEIKGYQAYIKAVWKPLLMAERGLPQEQKTDK
jgi:hypothetical protein